MMTYIPSSRTAPMFHNMLIKKMLFKFIYWASEDVAEAKFNQPNKLQKKKYTN